MNMKIQKHYFLIFMYVSLCIILKLKYDLYPITYNCNFLTLRNMNALIVEFNKV